MAEQFNIKPQTTKAKSMSELQVSATDSLPRASHQDEQADGFSRLLRRAEGRNVASNDGMRQLCLEEQKDNPRAASILRYMALRDPSAIDSVDIMEQSSAEGSSDSAVSHSDEFLLAYGYRVRIYLLDTGDIKQERTDGLFNFIYPKDREDLKDADGIMDAAGESVKHEYDTKKQNGDAKRGVIVTRAGNLPQKKIFHIEMHRNESKAKDSISAALRKADKEEMKSVTIPPLRDYGLHYMMKNESFQLGVLRMMLFEYEFKENPVCLHLIVTAPSERNSREKMMEEMRRYTEGSNSRLGSHYYTQ